MKFPSVNFGLLILGTPTTSEPGYGLVRDVKPELRNLKIPELALSHTLVFDHLGVLQWQTLLPL